MSHFAASLGVGLGRFVRLRLCWCNGCTCFVYGRLSLASCAGFECCGATDTVRPSLTSPRCPSFGDPLPRFKSTRFMQRPAGCLVQVVGLVSVPCQGVTGGACSSDMCAMLCCGHALRGCKRRITLRRQVLLRRGHAAGSVHNARLGRIVRHAHVSCCMLCATKCVMLHG